PIYYASEMPIVEFEGNLIAVDDDRVPEELAKTARKEWVRFRTLGDYPLSGATPSRATTLPDIVQEMLVATRSEREGRVIDKDPGASMEEKKRQGYY
ncbi:MAG: sulfate adenylyltransferase small subunit, partial [Planctomycetota bacterium]